MVWVISLATFFGCSTETKKEVTSTEKAEVYLELANASFAQNDIPGTLQSLAQAEKLDSKLPGIFHTKALAYFARHDLDAAISYARKAVSLKPDYSAANNTLGSLLISSGQYDLAMVPLKAAAQDPLYRDSYKSWTNLGILKFGKREYNQALVYFEHAVQDAPTLACGAYYYRGQIYQQQDRLNGAIESFRKATKDYCGHFGDSALALAEAYTKKKDYVAARREFLQVISRFPNTELESKAIKALKDLP